MSIVQMTMVLTVALACSMDSLVAGISYGCNKIKVPTTSTLIITIMCTIVIVVTLLLGQLITTVISYDTSIILGSTLLIILGAYKIIYSIIKIIATKKCINGQIKFRLFSLQFVLQILSTPEDADIDGNKVLSTLEAIVLSLALSLDGVAIGLGVGLTNTSWTVTLVLALTVFLTTFASLRLGHYIGGIVSKKTNLNLSWLSGVLLITIALLNLI